MKNQDKVRKGHIKKEERSEISILINKGYSCREIGRALGRSHTSISREIRANSVRGEYDSHKANQKAYVKRKYSKYQGMKIRQRPELEAHIRRKLKEEYTPEEIAGLLKLEDTHLPYVSAKGIYKYLYSMYGQDMCKYLYTKRYNKRKRKKKTERVMIPNRVGIEMRSKEANERLETGHFEGDTIVSGKKHKSKVALSVLFERKLNLVKIRKISNLKPDSNNRAILDMIKGIDVRTITFDNGIENTKHDQISAKRGVDIYFCDPYSSWQKGGVENINRLIRRFIPKGANIADYSHQYISMIENYLNNKPRKKLGFKTPFQAVSETNLFFNKTSPRGGAFEG